MSLSFDVVVVGGGIAGTSAALAASAQGASVAMLRAGPGVTGICCGAWNGLLPTSIARALERAGLPHVPCAHPLPHADGEQRTCSSAPASHAAARFGDDTLVCGIAGLPGFRAAALSRLWANAPDPGQTSPLDARAPRESAARERTTGRHVTVVLHGPPRSGWSSVSLAAALDRDVTLLAAPLARAVQQHRVSRVIVPAVLGIENTDAVRGALLDRTGAEVAEALGGVPSLPGWRLARALDRVLRDAGVELIHGRALRDESENGRAAGGSRRVGSLRVVVESRVARASQEVSAACFVLATGKFAGGGIAGTERFVETTLGVPVWIEHLGRRFYTPRALALTNLERRAPQPLMGAGVYADEQHRPIDENGDVVYTDVVVAGSIRAGLTTAGLSLGDAAQDGWRAGELAARRAA